MSKTHLVLSWWSEDEDADREEVESGGLGALTPIRNERRGEKLLRMLTSLIKLRDVLTRKALRPVVAA